MPKMQLRLHVGRKCSLPRAQRPAVLRVVGFAGNMNHSSGGSSQVHERVLRYPDGHVRRIRYPLETAATATEALEVGDCSEDWETLNVWKARQNKTLNTSTSQRTTAPKPKPHKQPKDTPNTSEQIPNSPLALLRVMTSQKHKQEQEQLWNDVRGSFEILTGCPWPTPKPLYLLASLQNEESEVGDTYMLRTRISMQGLESELTSLLRPNNKQNSGSGSKFMSCSKMVDGIIAFEDDTDAETFGHMLEEARKASGNSTDVSVARCDSHELFRDVQSVDAVVVLLRKGCKVPEPHQLAAALRNNEGDANSGF